MPNRKAGESKNDFMKRCIPMVIDEGTAKDDKQAYAICMSKWEEKPEMMKDLETKELHGVHIFDAGNWKGKEYNVNDIDDAINNFNNRVGEPYINLNHDDKFTETMKEFMKVSGLGYVKKLWRDGKKLMADFTKVPKTIAELINAGALKQKSVEWYKNYNHANGNKYGNVLKAVSFFGGDGFPAISTLDDVVALYKNENPIEQFNGTGELEVIETFKQEVVMDEKLLNAVQENGELKGKLSVLDVELKSKDAEISQLKNKLNEQSSELIKMKNETEQLEKLKADIEKQKAEVIKDEANKFADGLIASKKLLPKFKDFTVNQYTTFKNSGDENSLALFKEQLEGSPEIKVFNNLGVKNSVDQTDTKIDISDVFKGEPSSADVTSAYNSIDEKIEAHMKANGKSYTESAKILGYMN